MAGSNRRGRERRLRLQSSAGPRPSHRGGGGGSLTASPSPNGPVLSKSPILSPAGPPAPSPRTISVASGGGGASVTGARREGPGGSVAAQVRAVLDTERTPGGTRAGDGAEGDILGARMALPVPANRGATLAAPLTISRQTKAPEYVRRISGPAGRVTRGAGKDTAGFGGGGTAAPPADMLPLPLLRLRAPPPPPSARLRLPGSRSRRRLSGPRGPGAPAPGGGAWLRCPGPGGAPPHHMGPGERASALAPAWVTCAGVAATWPAFALLSWFPYPASAQRSWRVLKASPNALLVFLPPLPFICTCSLPSVLSLILIAPLSHFSQFNGDTGLGAAVQKVKSRSSVTPKKWSGSALNGTLVGF